MPLIEMSPNVQEAEGTRKRSHDEYAAEDVASKAGSDGAANPNCEYQAYPASPSEGSSQLTWSFFPAIHNRLGISPETPDDNHGMSDGSTLSPTRTPSPSPSSADKPSPATTSLPAHPKPDNPAKRKRLTPAEKAAKADEEAKKKKEREESRQQKAAEKAAEKARIEKEKAEAKAARQAEKARREEAEQEAKAAKQQEREDKKRKKDEEERKAREEKERKERSQLKLQSFFKKPTTPKKAAPAAVEEKVSPKKGSSPRKEKTAYERMFQPFFVKQHVRVAWQRPWLDDEAAEAKTRILDEYVSGERAPADVAPFNPLEALQVPAKPRREGRTHPSVRAVMDELQENPAALEKLRRVPVKLICFRQDVRPPYCGTLTAIPQGGELRLRRAARNPNGRVMELQYDYDSEAEWQDDEPGDDLDDLDDEEEEADDEDDMDGFLDDSEDAGVARRIFANEMEPESTGVCWDGDEGAAKLKPYRMEVMLGMSPVWPLAPRETLC